MTTAERITYRRATDLESRCLDSLHRELDRVVRGQVNRANVIARDADPHDALDYFLAAMCDHARRWSLAMDLIKSVHLLAREDPPWRRGRGD